VVLVSATFDQEGRLCVTQEGLMPTQRVTKAYNQRASILTLCIIRLFTNVYSM